MKQPNLTIVILSYNTSELTLRSVESVLALQLKCVVVDNHSSDDTIRKLQTLQDDNLKIIALQENKGFASGNNVALQKVTTEFVMLLNSDAYFDKETNLLSIMEYFSQHPEIGVMTPKVVLRNGALDPACHRGFPTPWNALCYFGKLEKLSWGFPILNRLFGGYHQTWKDLSIVHEVDACTGAAMLIRKSAMDAVGLLDEQFFMYGEDLDWCYRFKKKGWRIVYFPAVIVHHDKHSSGLKKGHSQSTHAFYEAMKLFYHKHYRHTFLSGLIITAINFLENRR
ncbi:MAG TPA: glycosyltransferase family 2 protein [Patescibacteria group bacterium]|nr:glycosyltransferase family 2 protein [Patescibacteria group bacterium]